MGAGDYWIDEKPDDLGQLTRWEASPKGFVEGWGGPPTMLWEPTGRLWARYGNARQSDFVLLGPNGEVMAPGGPMAFQSVAAAESLLNHHFGDS